MTMHLSSRPTAEKTAYEARFEALRLAFAPFAFQALKSLYDFGILDDLNEAGSAGQSFKELLDKKKLSTYALRVLLDSAEASGVVALDFSEESSDILKVRLTKVGHFMASDDLIKVQFNFSAEVCYLPLYDLTESLRTGKPEGLKRFGDWSSVYEGLTELPAGAQKAWFAFDHFFSDEAFHELLAAIEKQKALKILDVGGNTGRLCKRLLERFPDAMLTIADLPQQLVKAKENLASLSGSERINFYGINVLSDQALPGGQDIITMSQFLDCFSEAEIVSILKKAKTALIEGGRLYILETFIDRQKYEPAKYCVAQTSLYFTAVANGNSQMYRFQTFKDCLDESGFKVIESRDHIGRGHTLLSCEVLSQ